MVKLGRAHQLNQRQDFAQRLETIRNKTRAAAETYEKTFLREMVKAMRQTVPQGGLIKKNMAHNIFQEKLDHQYVEKWGGQGGIGLADIIYDQIIERFGPQMGMMLREQKPQGPIGLNARAGHIEMKKVPGGTSFKLENVSSESEGEMQIHSPWKGMLVRKDLLENGKMMAEISHEGGLTSRLLYSGSLLLEPGSKVESGQPIGLLSEKSRDLYWQLNANQIPTPESVVESVSL